MKKHLSILVLSLLLFGNAIAGKQDMISALKGIPGVADALWNDNISLWISMSNPNGGHNFDEIVNSLNQINSTENFSCIVANTIKGKGSSIMENKKNWHYWNKIDDKQIQKTLQELS